MHASVLNYNGCLKSGHGTIGPVVSSSSIFASACSCYNPHFHAIPFLGKVSRDSTISENFVINLSYQDVILMILCSCIIFFGFRNSSTGFILSSSFCRPFLFTMDPNYFTFEHPNSHFFALIVYFA